MKTTRRSFLKTAALTAPILAVGSTAKAQVRTNCDVPLSSEYIIEIRMAEKTLFQFIRPSQYGIDVSIRNGPEESPIYGVALFSIDPVFFNLKVYWKTTIHHLYIRPFSTSIALDDSPVLFYFDPDKPITVPAGSYLRSYSNHQQLYLSHGR